MALHADCGSGDPSDWGCEYDGNQGNWFAHMSSAILYIEDTRNPTVRFTSVPAGDADPDPDRDGIPNHRQEVIAFDLSDESGIRGYQLQIDGRVIANRDLSASCNHRLMAPCPGATGGNSGAPPLSLPPVQFDIDQLDPSIAHNVTLIAWDGAGRWNASVAPLAPSPRPVVEYPCLDGEVRSIVNPLVQQGCSGPGSPAGGDPAPTGADTPPPSGPAASTPTSAPAYFSYDLAFNPSPNQVPLDPGACRTLHAVVNGSGAGGALSNREMNQIVSVTIDLEGFSVGRELGQHTLKSTFSLPSRDTPPYREALGCPG